jgi:hypothetical protein
LLKVRRLSRLHPQGLVKRAVRLICCEEGDFHETVELFVEGTPIGKTLVSGHFLPDQTIDIPIDRFPFVNLPATIRFKAVQGTFDHRAEISIETIDQVFVAVGKGQVVLDGYVVEPGSIVINISNTTNGFWAPNVFVRFDTGVTRAANVEAIRRREEGGCQARLRVPLRAEDFNQAGLSLEILCMDRDGAVGQIEYRSVDPQSQVGQIARVAADLRSLYAVQALRIAAMESDFKRSLAAMEARLETFCEYILSLTYDRLAAAGGRDTKPPDAADVADFGSEAKRFLSEIKKESADLQTDADARHFTRRLTLLPNSETYFDGWNHLEIANDGRQFRWMQRAGKINLPCSRDALYCVVVKVGKIFSSKPPTLSAKIDRIPANVQYFALASWLELKITPFRDSDKTTGSDQCILTLECDVWGSPFEKGLGSDRRELSVLVWSVEVFTNGQAF